MATRTQKAPKKAKPAPSGKASAAKPSAKGGKTKGSSKAPSSASGGKPAKAGKSGKGRKATMVFEDAQTGERVLAFEEQKPGFFERMRLRRAERAEAKALEQRRLDAERREAEERARWAAQEQEKLRLEQERRDAEERARAEAEERKAFEAAEAEAHERQVAEERKAKAAARREAKKAEKEAEERRLAEEAEAKAAEKARAAEEKARLAEEEARAEEEAKARRAAERQAKRLEMEAEERRKADEQAAKDAEEEADRRRHAEQERLRKQREAEEAKAELEPEMEFQEASKPVTRGAELVPASEAASGGSAADVQADLVAAELSRRRSKPLVVEEPLPEPPRIPKAPLRPGETWADAPKPNQPPSPETVEAASQQPPDTFPFSIPEAFLLANEGGWDERSEKTHEGSFGGALSAALVLDLLMSGAVQVQRDRIVPTGTVPDDPALEQVLAHLRRIREKKGDLGSLSQMGQLAKRNREFLEPYKAKLAERALVTYGSRKHLGIFHRSWVEVTDEDARERLQNRLRRAIAGGGTPEARSILLLGLLDISGLFATVVPDEAADYNRKRLNGLLGGRDIMGYKVDPRLKALQEIAVRTVLANAKIMMVQG